MERVVAVDVSMGGGILVAVTLGGGAGLCCDASGAREPRRDIDEAVAEEGLHSYEPGA